MKPRLGASTPVSRWSLLAICLLAAALVAVPLGLGHSTGMFKDSSDFPHDFDQFGCTSCHNDNNVHQFVANDGKVLFQIVGPDGKEPAGEQYDPKATYTVNITLNGEQNPDAGNHAGFNLAVSAGKLAPAPGDAHVQASKDATQATHLDASQTHWSVAWTPPASGAVEFRLLVNDVNGNGGNDGGDHVYRFNRELTDATGAHLGAASATEVEFGISLQQYWIGLLGLAGMIFVMIAGFVYLKFVNAHNTDQKDR